jgi:ketosteroid isomerase-like protein
MPQPPSDPAANKRIVADFFDEIAKSGLAGAMNGLADDCVWWSATSGEQSKAQMLAVAGALSGLLAEPIVLETGAVTAEDDRVAVEARSRALRTNGVRYANEYHFLFRIQGGQIVEVREHNNTAHAAEVWGDLG